MELQKLKLSDVVKSPTNPREYFDKAELATLAADIEQRGLLQPILVRKKGKGFEVVAGEKRLRAHELAELPTIDALVTEMTDLEAEEAQIAENEKRGNLLPLEQAKGYAGIIQRHGLSADELAKKLGVARSTLYAKLKLNELCASGKKALKDGMLKASTAMLVAQVPAAVQAKAVEDVVRAGWDGRAISYPQAFNLLKREYLLDLAHAAFDVEDAKLLPEAGACGTCVKRTGAQPELQLEADRNQAEDLCTDSPCWALKTRLAAAARAAKLDVELLDEKEGAKLFDKYGKVTGGEYVEAEAFHPKSTTRQKYADLLTPAQRKTLGLLAVNPRGEVVSLLKHDGLSAAIEEAGKLKKAKATKASSPGTKASSKPLSEAEQAKAEYELAIRTKLATALKVACVAAVEKAGPTKAMLALIARSVMNNADMDLGRRGVKVPAYQLQAEVPFTKAFGKYTPAQLTGLIFEAGAGYDFAEAQSEDDLEEWTDALDIDVEKVEAAVRAATPKPKELLAPGEVQQAAARPAKAKAKKARRAA